MDLKKDLSALLKPHGLNAEQEAAIMAKVDAREAELNAAQDAKAQALADDFNGFKKDILDAVAAATDAANPSTGGGTDVPATNAALDKVTDAVGGLTDSVTAATVADGTVADTTPGANA